MKELILIKQLHQKKCDICHYWYFVDENFNYEPNLCKGCHYLMQKAMNFNNVTIISIKGNDYRIPFWYISKDDAINIMKNSNLNEKTESLQFFFIIYKRQVKQLIIKETEK